MDKRKALATVVVVAVVVLALPFGATPATAFTSTTEVLYGTHTTTTDFQNAEHLTNLKAQNGQVVLADGSTTDFDGFEDGNTNGWTVYNDGGGFGTSSNAREGSYAAEYFPGSQDWNNVVLYDKIKASDTGTMRMTGYFNARIFDSNEKPHPAFLLVDSDTGNYFRFDMANRNSPGNGFQLMESTDGGQTAYPISGTYGTYYYDAYIKFEIVYDHSTNTLTGRTFGSNPAVHSVSPSSGIDPDSFAVSAASQGQSYTLFDSIEMKSGAPSSATYVSDTYDLDNPTNATVDIAELSGGEAKLKVVDGNGDLLGSKTVTSPGTYRVGASPSLQTTTGTKVRVEVTDTGTPGDLSFAMNEEQVYFKDDPPDNPPETSPSGGETVYTNTPQLESHVDDNQFSTAQGDSVTAEWYIDGSKVAESGPYTSAQTITYEPTSLAEGSHTWHVRLVDDYGGATDGAGDGTGSFTVDHRAPDVDNSSATPSGGAVTAYSAETLQIDVSDGDFPVDGDQLSVAWYVDGTFVHETTGINSNGTVSYTTSSLSEGDHTWRVEVADDWGNLQTSDTFTYEVKHDDPALSNPSINGTTRYETNTLSVDVADADFPADGDTVDVGIYVEGSQVYTETVSANGTVSYDAGPYADGNYTWHAEAVDDYGYKTVTDNFTLEIQHDKPDVGNPSIDGVTHYENNTLAVDVADYDFAFDGDTVDVGFYVEGGLVSEQTISSNQTVTYDVGPYADGSYTWHVEAVDDYGYKTVTPTWDLDIHHYAPEIDNSTANLRGGEITNYEQNTLEIDVSDGDFPLDGDSLDVLWRVDGTLVSIGEATTNGTVSYTHDPLADGDHNWSVELVDDYGNSTKSDTFNFTIKHSAPVFDNSTIAPDGTISEQKPTFSIDMTDGDFGRDGDTVDVGLYVKESVEDSYELEAVETIYSNGTVEIVPNRPVSGNATYKFRAVDDYGYDVNSTTEDIIAPNSMFIHSEVAPYNRIGDNVTVAIITGSNGTANRSVKSNGLVTFGQLPVGETYVFSLRTEDYYPRGLYVNDLYARSVIFMVPQNATAHFTELVFSDATGNFKEPIIEIQTPINTTQVSNMPDNGPQWVTIGGDRLGVTGRYSTHLIDGHRYRFRVRNQQGDIRVLGFYTAKDSAVIDLQVGEFSYPPYNPSGYTWDVKANDTAGSGGAVTFAYNDPTDSTTRVNVSVFDRESGDLLGQDEFVGPGYGEIVYTLPVDQATIDNSEFLVKWNATRNGETINGSRLASAGTDNLAPPIDPMWTTVAYAGVVIIFAFGAGVWMGPPVVFMTLAGFGFIAVLIGIAPVGLGGGVSVLLFTLGALIQRQTNTVQPQ